MNGEMVLLKSASNVSKSVRRTISNDSEKIPAGRIIRSKVQNFTCVFNDLPDSNSNFSAREN